MAELITSTDIGTGLSIDGNGKLNASGASTPVFQDRLCPIGYANVNPNGSLDSSSGNVTVSRTGTGEYSLVPPAGAVASVFDVVESNNSRDDIQVRKTGFAGTQITIYEGDNGGAAGTLRDRPFTVIYYGMCPTIVGLI